jgi:hypothetical protein
MKKRSWMLMAAVAFATPVAAQNAANVVAARVGAETQAQQGSTVAWAAAEAGTAPTQELRQFVFEVQQAMGVQARITRGAPYSAETVTESIQVLGDGNRIVRKTMTRVFRDAEGRTRTEQIGANGEVQSVSIADPVEGANYMLNPQTRTAYHTGVIVTSGSGWASASVAPGSQGTITTTRTADGNVIVETKQAGGTGGGVAGGVVSGGSAGASASGSGAGGGRGVAGGWAATTSPLKVSSEAGKVTREDLGQQTIAGVLANGTRTTTVIPAGAIGNEQPIQVVSEQWFSPDLQVLVLTKYSDPRSGETTFRLTNAVRTDQPHTLFEVPADYTLQQSFIKREVAR